MVFLTVNSFFSCVFKNTDQKDICASIVFKAESKLKHEEKIFFIRFSSKTHFSGVKINSFLNSNLNFIFAFVL